MLTDDDIQEAFTAADNVVDRARRGLPHDRWFVGTPDMENFVRAYVVLTNITADLTAEIQRRGAESMALGATRCEDNDQANQ